MLSVRIGKYFATGVAGALLGCGGHVDTNDVPAGAGGTLEGDDYGRDQDLDLPDDRASMGGSCSESVTAVDVPEDHCIHITGWFSPGATSVPECLSLTCDDLEKTNVSLWRGWGDAVRYVHHVPECGSFEYDITPGPCP